MASSAEEIRRQLEESARVKQSFFRRADRAHRTICGKMRRRSPPRRQNRLLWKWRKRRRCVAPRGGACRQLRTDRRGLAALALTTNPSVLTAAGNDYGFEHIFSRQIESLVAPQDVLVALSTSGASPNIVRGVEAGRARGAYVVAFTGETGGALADKVDLLLNVPSQDPQRIQEAHITIGHIACSLIEQMATT